MASPLRIPRPYEKALVKVRQLSDESAQELLAALQKTPDTINPSSLSLAVAAQVDTIAASDVEEIVPALLSLYSLLNYSDAAISDVVRDVAQTLEESGPDELRLSPEERAEFENRLAELLSVSRLDDMARAGGLLQEVVRMAG